MHAKQPMIQRTPTLGDAAEIQALRNVLAYDPQTGLLTWLVKRGNARVGAVAGYVHNALGYIFIGYKIDGYKRKMYLGHRLAWAFTHGVWPVDQLDHINMDRSDNRIENLREANNQQNTFNRRAHSNSGTGIKGVTYNPKCTRRPWGARLNISGRGINCGQFATREEAQQAYRALVKAHCGEFAHPSIWADDTT